MVPNVNPRGHSFKGVTAYLLHDKEAQTSNRVAWTATENLHTENIENAAKVMAYTDKNAESLKRSFGGSTAGAKGQAGAVYHFSLSEHTGNAPTQDEWRDLVLENIKSLGLENHQYYMVAHNDEPHSHVHVVVNLVNPETGVIKQLYNDFKTLDRVAHDYELKNGIVCENRDKKYKAWEQEKQAFKEKELREEYASKVTKAFNSSDNAQSFKAALEYDGLTLAQGNRRGFVLVDSRGQVFALNRLISFEEDIKRKEKNAAINEKLKGIDKASLPIADKLADSRQFIDRDALETKQQKTLSDAANEAAKVEAEKQVKIEKIEQLTEKIYQAKRKGILTAAKVDWRVIKVRQEQEKQALEVRLRKKDTQKEKWHREHWQPIIAKEKRNKAWLEAQLEKKGVSGLIFRVRYGKEAREEIIALGKNIDNATRNLKSGIGGLTKRDRYELMQQGRRHTKDRESLKSSIDKKLNNAKLEASQEATLKLEGRQISKPAEKPREQSKSYEQSLKDRFNDNHIIEQQDKTNSKSYIEMLEDQANDNELERNRLRLDM